MKADFTFSQSGTLFSRVIHYVMFFTLLISTHLMNADPGTNALPTASTLQRLTLGGGCFWCLEAYFEKFQGVQTVVSGYSAGKTENPTYQQICQGDTGHAEVVQITFDPNVISVGQLLEIFWEIHDPTTLNRQGADVGTQYRSIILYENDAQKQAAEKSQEKAGKNFPKPMVTEMVALQKFYPAEDYHQDYYRKNPQASYCAYVISPKLEKLKKSKWGSHFSTEKPR